MGLKEKKNFATISTINRLFNFYLNLFLYVYNRVKSSNKTIGSILTINEKYLFLVYNYIKPFILSYDQQILSKIKMATDLANSFSCNARKKIDELYNSSSEEIYNKIVIELDKQKKGIIKYVDNLKQTNINKFNTLKNNLLSKFEVIINLIKLQSKLFNQSLVLLDDVIDHYLPLTEKEEGVPATKNKEDLTLIKFLLKIKKRVKS